MRSKPTEEQPQVEMSMFVVMGTVTLCQTALACAQARAVTKSGREAVGIAQEHLEAVVDILKGELKRKVPLDQRN